MMMDEIVSKNLKVSCLVRKDNWVVSLYNKYGFTDYSEYEYDDDKYKWMINYEANRF